MTNFDKLRMLGEALYGPRWQNAIARDLGLNPRQVNRWKSGQYEPHDGQIANLIAIANTRSLQITEAIASAKPLSRKDDQAEGLI